MFQRLINQSLYQEILLLQKFNAISGKVLKPQKNQPPTSENETVFIFCLFFELGFQPRNFSVEKKSFHANLKNVN